MIPAELLSYFKKIYPRKDETHKGDYGKVFLLAGSRGMTGAAYLTSISVLRAGAGLVYLGIPEGLNGIMEVKLTEVITIPLPQTAEGTLSLKGLDKIHQFLSNCDLLVMGPGLSRQQSTQELLRKIVATTSLPLILDADGINAFEGVPHLLEERKTRYLILTPHLGEFARLLNKSIDEVKKQKFELARDFAQRYSLTLLLKGHKSRVVSQDGQSYLNETGNPGMATAGAGDVLTGMIAGLRVQGLTDFEASCLATYMHGRAGDIAAEKLSPISLIATDILEHLPLVFKEFSLFSSASTPRN